MCEQGKRVVACIGSFLQPLRSLLVQTAALGADYRPIHRFLDQDMLEPELRLRPPSALANQVDSLQLTKRFPQLLLAACDPREKREAEATADH